MRPPKADASWVLVCEDVRVEASQRLSLMGIYGPIMDVPALPGMLSGLSAVAFIRNPKEPLTDIRMQVIDPSGNKIEGGSQPVVPVKDVERLNHAFAKLFPFPVPTEGVWTFRFTFNGAEEIGIETSLRVRRVEASSP